MTQVLIVGAGPVGLTLALECHRHGVHFRIIDKNPLPSDKSKALAVWSGTIECMAAMNVVDDFLATSRPIHRVIMCDTGRVINHTSIHEGIESVYPLPFISPQSQTEEILIRKLKERGVEVERSVELIGFTDDSNGVECSLKQGDGSIETVKVEWLAGCDGGRSLVRHQLPVEFKGMTEDRGFILIDAKIEGEMSPDSIMVNWGPTCVCAFFPVKEGVFRMFAQRPDMTNKQPPTLEEMQETVQANGLGRLRFYDPEWLAWFGVNERYTTRVRVGHVFLCGDAAHIHSPAGGQGMNTGMQDAYNLGWKLGLLCRGKGDPEVLAESVHEERHPVAQTLVEKTTKLLHVAMANNMFIRLAKDVAATLLFQSRFVQKKLSGELSELHITYPTSQLILPDNGWPNCEGFHPGSKPRDVELIHPQSKAAVSLWRQFLTAKHTLVLFSGRKPGERTVESLNEVVDAVKPFDTELQVLVIYAGDDAPVGVAATATLFLDPTGKAHERYGLHDQPSWYLVRPDQYLAARSVTLQTASLLVYLEKAVGQRK